MYRWIGFFVLVFVYLGYIVIVKGGLWIDSYISNHIHLIYTDSLTLIAKAFSFIGGMKESLVLSAFFVWFLYHKKYYNEVRLYLYTLFSSIVLFISIKQIIARARPHSILVDAYNYSFPSGHSTMAMAIGLAVYFIYKNRVKSPYWLLIISISWAICVACSRVYLNVHYVSDILAGLILGAICALSVKTILSFKTLS